MSAEARRIKDPQLGLEQAETRLHHQLLSGAAGRQRARLRDLPNDRFLIGLEEKETPV